MTPEDKRRIREIRDACGDPDAYGNVGEILRDGMFLLAKLDEAHSALRELRNRKLFAPMHFEHFPASTDGRTTRATMSAAIANQMVSNWIDDACKILGEE